MASVSTKYPFGSAQEHIPTCEKHDLIIDLICEDCDKFICSQCAKTDHKDHDWKTISTTGIQRRKELQWTLGKVKEEDVKEMDEKIQKTAKLIEENQRCCHYEVSKLERHYNEIVARLDKIKKNIETKLRENLERKNAELGEKKVSLEKEKKRVIGIVQFLEEKHNYMSEYNLIDNLRDLTNLLSNRDNDIKKGNLSVRYRKGDISKGFMESMIGQIFDLDDITVSETDSFHYQDKLILAMEAINEDTCFVRDLNSDCIEQVNIKNEEWKKINISNVRDVCITDNGDLYTTDSLNDCIVRISQSGAVSTAFSTAPLMPCGICQPTEGGLLVTLEDRKSASFQPDSESRRLISHVRLSGDVIREYEYQEDGKTRLFTSPWKVRQNVNTDICVVNWTSLYAGHLVIVSSSGSLRGRYNGQKLKKSFKPNSVACDSNCNIIVNDEYNSKIHLLSPDGDFLKYLLTENEVSYPWAMSLYKSVLWLGDLCGYVKVFHFNET